MSTQPIGWSDVPVDVSSMPATRDKPAENREHDEGPERDSTGNQARVLSALRTAHERLAISHDVWNRLMPPVSTLAAAAM